MGQTVSIPAITNCPTTTAADGAAPRPGASPRRPGRFAYLNVEEAVDRLGITNPETVRALQRCAAGIKGEPVPSEVGRDDAFFKSMSEQRRVPRKRPEEAYARDLTFRSGERWLWDISAAFECAFDSVRYLVIFVCRRSGLVRIYPVKDKSARTVIEHAIEPLRVFVRMTRPDVRLLSIHGDADSAVSQWGHGEHQDNAEVRAYNAQLADPILIRRSPANMHSMNACEPHMKRLSYLSNRIRQRWALGRIFDADAMIAAGEQLNDTPVPFSTNPGLHEATRWKLYSEGEETSDLSRWVGEPGQSLWAHVAGSKANMGEPKARAGIFLYPLRGAGGFVIRMLESRRLMVAYSISLVNDRHLRHARLLERDQGTGGHG
jgi:hypothetical protein